jgi:hypothetical protein
VRRIVLALLAVLLAPISSVRAQTAERGVVEIPLRVEDGRLVVGVSGPEGATHDFVLGLAMASLSESGAARLGSARTSLTLGDVPVALENAATVPDSILGLGSEGPVGVLGGETLNGHDILIDAAGGRLVLKPLARSVRWDGVALSNPVPIRVFHDVLIRVDIEVAGKLFGALMDLSPSRLEVNEGLSTAAGLSGPRVDSFRMGYSGWPSLPVEVVDSPVFRGWDPDGHGFAVIGAVVAYDCALAISWYHQEMRTCLR